MSGGPGRFRGRLTWWQINAEPMLWVLMGAGLWVLQQLGAEPVLRVLLGAGLWVVQQLGAEPMLWVLLGAFPMAVP